MRGVVHTKHIKVTDIPASVEQNAIYEFVPVQPDEAFYNERTDRNIGWISPEEQQILKQSRIAIAGLGGMGGAAAPSLLRMGVGQMKLADLETFDASNINRQFGAGRYAIGRSKVFETIRLLRQITDDTTLVAYPRGVNEHEVEGFVDGCDLVLDMVEFWALSARILLHKTARSRGCTVVSANPVGMGTRLFWFDERACDIETFLGVTYEEALEFEEKMRRGTAGNKEKMRIIASVMSSFVPELPFYADSEQKASNHKTLRERIMKDNKPSVIGSNLAMAGGFLANHVVLYLLRNSNVKRRKLPRYPSAPGYIYFDSAFVKAAIRHNGVLVKLLRLLYRLGVRLAMRKVPD